MDLATLGLRIDASGVVSGVAQAEHSLDSLGEKGLHIAERLEKTFVTLATTAGLGVLGEHLISESIQAQNAVAQLQSAVKAAGSESGVTSRELEELANHLQDVTTYSHQATEGAEALLLTFQHITPENLKRATADITDLAARMGGDLQSAALQVGKALEDPERGLLALRRAGVVFSATEQGVIKDLYDTGHAAQAQELILAGLEKRFQGSAAAARDTLGGALHGVAMSMVDLFETTREESGGVIGSFAFDRGSGESPQAAYGRTRRSCKARRSRLWCTVLIRDIRARRQARRRCSTRARRVTGVLGECSPYS
jgi:hypothetical protein